MAVAHTLSVFQSNLKRAQNSLDELDDNIKRVTGRDPKEQRTVRRYDNNFAPKRPRPTEVKERVHNYNDLDADEHFNRRHDRDMEDCMVKSKVVPVKCDKTRADVAKVLGASEKERGKRLFGFLQGTLNAAKKENEQISQMAKEERRRQIHTKLEQKQKQEKEHFQKERTELFFERKEKEIKLFALKEKVRLTAECQAWKEDILKMVGHIRTTSKPFIFYKPNKETKESRERMSQTEQVINDMVHSREHRLLKELDEIEENQQRRLRDLRSRTVRDNDDDDDDDDEKDSDSESTSSSGDSPVDDEDDDEFSNNQMVRSHVVVSKRTRGSDDDVDLDSREVDRRRVQLG